MNYLLTIKLQPDAEETIGPAGMTRVFCRGAIEVWSNCPGLSLGEHGWVGGHVFGRGRPYALLSEFHPSVQQAASATQGRALFDLCWGGFVGVWCDGSGRFHAFRDPSGFVPAFMARSASRILISSDARLLGKPCGIDPLSLGRFLSSIDAIGRHTCLRGVEEIMPGESLEGSPGVVDIAQWWAPWMAVPATIPSFEEGAALIRERVTDCTEAWSSVFGGSLLGLSGGLDSSIVAASASDIRCMTVIGPDPEGDERRYAKAVTDHIGIELEQHHLDPTTVDFARSPVGHLPWPTSGYFWHAIKAIHQHCQSLRPFNAIFSGNGGDNIFCSMRSAVSVADRWTHDGLGRGSWQTLKDVQELTGVTLVEVFREARRRHRQYDGHHRPASNVEGLSASMRNAIRSHPAPHPWFAPPKGILAGKATHIALLARAHKTLEIYPRDAGPHHIAPLLSQPVVEACLSLPSWYWVRGGVNRAAAREAFRDALPQSIIRRQSKGGPGGFVEALYAERHAQLRDMLRDGILVNEGIIDRSYVEAPYDPTVKGRQRAQRLMAFGATEAWARGWQSAT